MFLSHSINYIHDIVDLHTAYEKEWGENVAKTKKTVVQRTANKADLVRVKKLLNHTRKGR